VPITAPSARISTGAVLTAQGGVEAHPNIRQLSAISSLLCQIADYEVAAVQVGVPVIVMASLSLGVIECDIAFYINIGRSSVVR
jgi:hypothetical protein